LVVRLHSSGNGAALCIRGDDQSFFAIKECAARALRRQREGDSGARYGLLAGVFHTNHGGIAALALTNVMDGALPLHNHHVQRLRGGILLGN
jgi:hypothetical protein